ncbi:hypothetical protein [Kitasatospora cheerisanensis]|uniref:Large Ala/Glu-rich protein n=1 Tax=Kitasatospora cheerisanensis KCTC 2395 TaxID=1348663 RepID=A0A066YKM7_9ACTN|nr:hypothetical protein [Kitasatospora cheerisanensis]KDN80494.1 hypothetical protein KCH_77280 [Kitasatospora cheerisanensis KCTC 2395]
MTPARTTAPRKTRTAPAKPPAKTAQKPRPAAAPKPAGTPPKTPTLTVSATFGRPAADPVLADAADRAADIRDLARADADALLRRARLAADAELATAQQWTSEAETLRAVAAAEAETVTQRAEETARRALEIVTDHADLIRQAAAEDAEQRRGEAEDEARRRIEEAEQQAAALTRAAAEQADEIRVQASERARRAGAAEAEQILARAEQTAAELTRTAEQQAGRTRIQADQAAAALRARAEQQAEQACKDAAEQADTLIGDARTRAAGLLETARAQADELRRAAEDDAERLRVQARRLREDADREVDQATGAAREVRAKAAAEADQVRDRAEQEAGRQQARAAAESARLLQQAKKDADRILRQAEQAAAAVKAETDQALAEANEATLQAQEMKQLAAQVLDDAAQTLHRATARTTRKLENRRLKREARAAERAGKATAASRVKAFAKANSRRLLAIVPITAPMAVAWTGQAGFAHDILGWIAPFTVLFAAAWELSTAFVAWMYHEARKVGDSGTLYRISTWAFAVGAAVMNYWHASATVTGQKWDPAAMKMVDQLTYWDPTPKAVAFSAMSITGMVLWELYARLIHRTKLRADGKVAKSRPTIGAIRWARYPGHSFTAWSLAITDESLSTVELAWSAAAKHRAMVRRTGLGPVRRFIAAAIGVGDWMPLRALPAVPNRTLIVAASGSPNPAAIPRFAVRLTRAGSPNHIPNRPGGSPNPALPAARSGATGGRRELEAANRTTPTGEPAGTGPGPRTAADQQRTIPDPDGSNRRSAAQELADEQVRQVLALIEAVGYDTVDLDYVMANLGLKKTTAYHRLASARREFANRAAA